MKNTEKISAPPWTLNEKSFPLRIVSADGDIVCDHIPPSGLENARLICRAPKMLEEILELRRKINDLTRNREQRKTRVREMYRKMRTNLEESLRTIEKPQKNMDDVYNTMVDHSKIEGA